MSTGTAEPTYHVLLIGIDSYPPGYNSLSGCVNDIDGIERLLLEPPGVGFPPERIRVTRLAAPGSGRSSSWQSSSPALAPTRANLLQALQALAGPAVAAFDRVLIYYSGHGDETVWKGSTVWHESLVPNDGREVEHLFDVEINALIGAIAQRTADLTVVLDCCHSAGATKDLKPSKGAVRSLAGPRQAVDPPDLSALGLGRPAAQLAGRRLLQSATPNYLVAVACQADETAAEGAYPFGQPASGVFTHSLLALMEGRTAEQRARIRWTDIWPALLAKVAARNRQLDQRPQHPWLIGRTERKVFGGSWEEMDPGYQVSRRSDGKFDIGAGSLMGVTPGAEVAVYGPAPRFFPKVGSPEDRPAGRLRVESSAPSSAVGVTIGVTFVLPEGARGRLVKPGDSQRLRVSLAPEDAELKAELEASKLLEVVPSADPDPEVQVVAQPRGPWVIANDVEPALAVVPSGYGRALVAGLEHYYRCNTVLRMARNCNDPQLDRALAVEILDCNGAALAGMTPEQLADPALPEAPRDGDAIYNLPEGFEFCVRATNHSSVPLSVTLLSCSPSGVVDYLSDDLLRGDDSSQVFWLDGKLGSVFVTGLDELPPAPPGIVRPRYSTDRLIAIGTTRRDLRLDYLKVNRRVQEVVQEVLATAKDLKPLRPPAKTEPAAPAELWTATVTHVRIRK